jgi:uncharacterized protein
VLQGDEALQKYERLMQETLGLPATEPLVPALADRWVNWRLQASLRQLEGRPDQVWLQVQASTVLPTTCQRCLGLLELPVDADRALRFVADEATALAEDEWADEDVLVLQAELNLHALIEDELLLALPLIPKHEVCPVALKLAVADADFEQHATTAAKPFAALVDLQALLTQKPK